MVRDVVQISDGDSSADQGIYDQIIQITQKDINPSQIQPHFIFKCDKAVTHGLH